MKKIHTRRKRRQAKMVARSHGKFKVGHKRKGGRTGSSRPGREFKETTAHTHRAKAVRPRAFIFGEWCLCDKVVDTIVEQERLERFGAQRMTAPPDMDPAERAALNRVYEGCIVERDRALKACTGHERFVFDSWRRVGLGLREAIKAVLTDRDIGRKDARRKALHARPLGPGDVYAWFRKQGLGPIVEPLTRR